MLAAHVSVETHIVEKRFDAMTDRFDEQVEAAVTRISNAAESLLDEQDGALPQALAAHRSELDQLLGDTFDPDSKRSVISLFEDGARRRAPAAGVRDAAAASRPTARTARSPGSSASSCATCTSGSVEVRRDVAELSEKIAVTEAVAPVLELTTGKGFKFEDVLDACVSRIAAQHGDVAEHVGTETGLAGTQKGDEIVTLNPTTASGYEARFALEAKSRKLTMRNTLKELDDALENREALAAIAVFTTQEQAPTSVPFHYAGNKAIVVLDKEGLDDAALRLAYMWARWVVRRDLCGAPADELDLERVVHADRRRVPGDRAVHHDPEVPHRRRARASSTPASSSTRSSRRSASLSTPSARSSHPPTRSRLGPTVGVPGRAGVPWGHGRRRSRRG